MDVDTGEGFAHPLMRWLAGVGEQLDGAVECPILSLPLGEYESALRQIAACEAKLASLRLRLTRQAELYEVRKPVERLADFGRARTGTAVLGPTGRSWSGRSTKAGQGACR
jgi:hypothetical protein